MQHTILTHHQIQHKIKRIGYQIYETFVEDSEVVLAGIADGGYILAEKIAKELAIISDIKITLCKVEIDKKNVHSPIQTSIPKTYCKNKGLVVIDDVLHSGTTLIYTVKHFLDMPTTKFKTAVLVDRNHKKYPIKADFKGISLSTSLQEHVEVVFKENDSFVYLN